MRRKTVGLFLLILSLSVAADAAPPPVPRGPEFRINTSTAFHHYSPSIAAFPDGGFVVVWNSGWVRARFLDARGRPGREVRLAVSPVVDQVVADSDGSFLVAWSASTPASPAAGIFVRRFNRDGTPRGKRIRVSNLSTSERSDPVIAIGPEGRFAVAWKADVRVPDTGGTYTNAVGRIFSADGTPVTPEILLFAGEPATAAGDDVINAFSGSLALKPDGTLVALVQADEGGRCFQRVLVQVPPGGEPASLAGLGPLYCGSPGRDRFASLAVRPDGSLIAAWSDYAEIQAQRFAPDGTPLGESFRVSQNVDDRQYAPAIALQTGGRFVIAWTEEGPGREVHGFFGRSFTANGVPRTGDYRINLTTEGDQFDLAIAASRQGPIVAVWTQAIEGRSDIFARVLAPWR